MIRFCRSIKPFYAITLDLDSILYDNYPIICKAEEKVISFLKKYHPALFNIKKKIICVSHSMVKSIDPEIHHDVNY